jgi:hypothetical protein
MRSATFLGSCSMATWQVGRAMDFPPAFLAPASSMAGLNVRSLVEITCQDGFYFHAAWVNFSSNIGPQICPWTARTSRRSDIGSPSAKLLRIPSGDIEANFWASTWIVVRLTMPMSASAKSAVQVSDRKAHWSRSPTDQRRERRLQHRRVQRPWGHHRPL